MGVLGQVDVLAELDQLQLALGADLGQTEGLFPQRPLFGTVESEQLGRERSREQEVRESNERDSHG